MKALIQRVKQASVEIDGCVVGKCKAGYMILFCAVDGDSESDIDLLARKTVNLRVFEDADGKMNKSILDVDGEILCISQFTLAADVKKCNRPSFINAMEPVTADKYYNLYCKALKNHGVKSVETGRFGADMQVSIINDGQVTIMLDTDIWNKKV